MKVDARSGLQDEEFLWLTLGESIFSCWCPHERVQVGKATGYFVRKGDPADSPSVLQGLSFSLTASGEAVVVGLKFWKILLAELVCWYVEPSQPLGVLG